MGSNSSKQEMPIPKVITDFLERSFTSSSSQNKDNDLVGSEIALFAKYFPENNRNKDENENDTKAIDDDNEDYQFWTCFVSKSNESSDKLKRDYFLSCSVGESAPVDLRMLTSARNPQKQQNKNNNYDNHARKTSVPPDDRIHVWLRSDYGNLYKIRPASKDECKDFETKIAGSYSSSSYGRVWRDRGLGVPTQLCKTGVHFGPTVHEQDLLRSGQVREIEVADEAARQGTAFFSKWTLESMASFSIFGMSVAEMQTKREQSAR